MTFETLRSSLSYSPYFVFILNLDAEWSQRRGQAVESPYRQSQRRVAELCDRYAEGINANFAKFSEGAPDPEPSLSEFLFRPLFYVPWGHADCQAIILLDDFEAIHHLTAGVDTTIEELCLGFCPTIRSFGLGTSEKLPLMVELGEHFSEEPHATSRTQIHATNFQKQMPLLAFTRYKIDAFASIGFGLLFQEALFAALPELIQRIHSSLTDERPTSAAIQFIMDDTEDLRNTRISFVDLQGAEELGSFIFCRNYSVAMTLIASLRSLTYGDLFDASDAGRRLEDALQSSRVVDRLLKIQPNSQTPRSARALRANHVFRWTHTTLSVTADAFFGNSREARANCRGWVSAVAEIQVPPGHHARTYQQLPKSLDTSMPSKRVPEAVTLYEAGRGDYLHSFAEPMGASCIRLSDAIQLVLEKLATFGTVRHPDHGRDVVDCATLISVPVIDTIAGSKACPSRDLKPEHFSLFGTALPEIRRRLCYPEMVPSGEHPNYAPFSGRLSLQKLRTVLKTYGVPVVLRRNIEFLFQNFAILVSDYYAFDSVIDLYDAFATLHATLTEQLSEVRHAEIRGKHSRTIPPLDDARVEAISRFVDALHNALSHRLRNAFSEPMVRDMAIDLRGGLNQLLAAADVPLKCGLGLLRKYAISSPIKSVRREIVGGLTRISVRPGMRAFSLNLGTERQSQLCFVEADVPHVMHVASFCDYVHEAAHLIFAALKGKYPGSGLAQLGSSTTTGDSAKRRARSLNAERLNEIFAYVFLRILFFPKRQGDQSLKEFVLDQLISYVKSQNGSEASDTEMVVQISELLVRLAIADVLVPNMQSDSAWLNQPFVDQLNSTISRRNAIERLLEAASPALPNCDRLWRSMFCDGWAYCVGEFDHIYNDLCPYLDNLWNWTKEVFQPYIHDTCDDKLFAPDQFRTDLQRVVQECVDSGVPLSRCRLKVVEKADCDEAGIDALLLTCTMLSKYIARREMAADRRLFLDRDPATGNVQFDSHAGPWNAFLIDRGAASMFCCVPAERGRRLQQQVSIIKSLWDIASNFRSRRLCEIIADNWAIID